ncbi:ATP-binding cassette domain-containing protein [Paroceanicella profunda]|uniref:ATP-binding cassette domain-containing protein n=1 Tax=Paroceanicella profunda TaxID=2579971 RepID=A0A5B8FIP0_9RHOB|nr:ATP-binding cassette domain-containing protein [Paroceanicella profunda]QDL93318.1 ATP-binding cassette domain-containing protein [Paroceanicella profunda]
MMRITDLSAGYGGRPVLSGITLHVGRGETVAVLGANTAGKTTLIKAIGGLLPSVSGSIAFDGQEITALPAYERVSRGLAVVPEGRHVFPDMTVEENLLIGAYHRRHEPLAEDMHCWMSLRTDPALSSRFDPPVSMSVGS